MAEKRIVLITGADGALGKEVVRKLLQEGWHLHACVHREQAGLDLQKAFPEAGAGSLTVFTGDVTDAGAVREFVNSVGNFHAVVHIAGGFRAAEEFEKNTDADFDFLVNLNLRATFLLLRAVMPAMREHKDGAIVTIGAKNALHPVKVNAAYNASKAAVISLTLTAAEEGRADQVRANVIVPAVIRTEANKQWAASEKEMEKWTPPEDIADTIAFLISDDARGVTGTVIPMYNKMNT